MGRCGPSCPRSTSRPPPPSGWSASSSFSTGGGGGQPRPADPGPGVDDAPRDRRGRRAPRRAAAADPGPGPSGLHDLGPRLRRASGARPPRAPRHRPASGPRRSGPPLAARRVFAPPGVDPGEVVLEGDRPAGAGWVRITWGRSLAEPVTPATTTRRCRRGRSREPSPGRRCARRAARPSTSCGARRSGPARPGWPWPRARCSGGARAALGSPARGAGPRRGRSGRPAEAYAAGVTQPDERGPFFHGTRAEVSPGDLLVAGRPSNYRPEVVMNHVYFTALCDGAGLAAELAVVLGGGDPHVYEVEPTVPSRTTRTSRTRSSPATPRDRSAARPRCGRARGPRLDRLTPEALQQWTERLTVLRDTHAEIVN